MPNDNTQFFIKELAFEQALANLLHTSPGWDGGIMMNPTEEDLVQNWANTSMILIATSIAWATHLLHRQRCSK